MNKEKRGSFLPIIFIIFIIMFISNVSSFGSLLISFPELFGWAKKIFTTIGIGILVLIALIICAIIIGVSSKKKKDKQNINTNQDFYDILANQRFENNRIIIDENSYLQLTDLDTIIPETIDIYMNNEYIGSLAEFKKAYPNAYNALQKSAVKNMSKKKKRKQEEVKVQLQQEEKGCIFFIQTFQKLLVEIEVEEVKQQILETLGYLRQIKQIEDEFGESKNKTRKLYEYYLPMYADILANYDRLHDNAPLSQEFKDNEVKLLKTSDLINTALKNITASLVDNYHTNLNVDMKTLESILKKDGLVNDVEVERHE